MRGHVGRTRSPCGGDVADIKRTAQEVPLFGREKRKCSAQKGRHRIAKPAQDGARIQVVATMCVDAISPA